MQLRNLSDAHICNGVHVRMDKPAALIFHPAYSLYYRHSHIPDLLALDLDHHKNSWRKIYYGVINIVAPILGVRVSDDPGFFN